MHYVENIYTHRTNDVKEGASKVKVTVVLTNGEDGYYVAECPKLPGCVSQGKTREEAINNIREAIQLTIQTRKKLRLPDFDVNVETVELYIS